MCGGNNENIEQSCFTLSQEGTWDESHHLISPRAVHSSWQVEGGIFLLGGRFSENTTEFGPYIIKAFVSSDQSQTSQLHQMDRVRHPLY